MLLATDVSTIRPEVRGEEGYGSHLQGDQGF